MEDIINYLVIGFFIISFLSSFFKKKPAPNKKAEPAHNTNESSETKKAVDPFEIFFNTLNKNEIHEEELIETSDNPAEEYSEVDEYFEKALRKSSDSEIPPVPSTFQETVNNRKEETAETTSVDLLPPTLSYKTRENKRTEEIRNALKNPERLKDYILLQEILGTPKALQE